LDDISLYEGREQTAVKHFILSEYLRRFAHIIGFRYTTITYVDCFSGPWNVRSDNLADSSFQIAINELRSARLSLKTHGRTLKLRCYFLEKDSAAFQRLREFASSIADVDIQTVNGELAGKIPDIVDFVKKGGPSSFPFIFIDPKGWSGFPLTAIYPLLRIDPSEVLINFMTNSIVRFVEQSFASLLGSPKSLINLGSLSGDDREDAALQSYSDIVKQVGHFSHVCAARILRPDVNRTSFHLLYCTRSPKGVEVFKQAEERAMEVMETERAKAGQRKRISRQQQAELFAASQLHDPHFYESLRLRYTGVARRSIQELLERRGRVEYDEVWSLALTNQLVWERDLKKWIREWADAGDLELGGLQERQRVPQRGKGNFLVWQTTKR
jgi:three-Cys-motif partner protein